MHLQFFSFDFVSSSMSNRGTFYIRLYHRVYQKKLIFSDLVIGWQKVAFGVKTNTNTKIFNFGCRLTPIFLTFPWKRSKISKNWHNSRTIGDRKLQHTSKVAEHLSSYQCLIHFVGLIAVVFEILPKNYF